MSELWDQLNHPNRHEDAPLSTYDAVAWALICNDGWYEPRVREKIKLLSDQQIKQLLLALRRHQVNPFIAVAIGELLA